MVYESLFGNTRDIARAVAEGLAQWSEPTLASVDETPRLIDAEVALVVAGGPTHAFSMSRTSTRKDAADRGAHVPMASGLRDWIDGATVQAPVPLATFDTHVSQRWVPGSASRSAARHGRDRGFRAVASESFYVRDMQGPLEAGELDRARQWGNALRVHC